MLRVEFPDGAQARRSMFTGAIVEAFLPQDVSGLLPASPLARLVAAVIFGLGIGLVSSLLGVAGGELIIPTLVFAFGVGIKTAGTASLLVSLPTVAVGVIRHRGLGAYSELRSRPYGDGGAHGGRIGDGSRGRRASRRYGPSRGAQACARRDLDRIGSAHLLPLRRIFISPLTNQHFLVHTPIK
jgi:hypothetical protein